MTNMRNKLENITTYDTDIKRGSKGIVQTTLSTYFWQVQWKWPISWKLQSTKTPQGETDRKMTKTLQEEASDRQSWGK